MSARTVVIGNSGSGKTWLAQRLARLRGVPCVHLDDLFWMPGRFDIKRPAADVAAIVDEQLRVDGWVVEGVFGDLAAQFLPAATQLLWLHLPWAVCEQRLRGRGAQNSHHHGRQASPQDLGELLEWAGAYDTRLTASSEQGHRALFDGFALDRHELCSESAVMAFLRQARLRP